MKTNKIVLTLFLAIVLVSCNNSSELKFLGKNLSVSCEEFEKHLEKNGFKYSRQQTYEGEYLGEDIGVIVDKKKNGHYTHLGLMLVSDDVNKSKRYYEKLCEEIRKEHSGFKEMEKEKDSYFSYKWNGKSENVPTHNDIKEYSNGAGKKISISYYKADILFMVTAIFESED